MLHRCLKIEFLLFCDINYEKSQSQMAKSDKLLDLIIDDMMKQFDESTDKNTLIKQIKILLDEKAIQQNTELEEKNAELDENHRT